MAPLLPREGQLTELNKKLSAAKKPKVSLVPADGNLERDDLVEMANVGLVQYTVMPSQLWKNVVVRQIVAPASKDFFSLDVSNFGFGWQADSSSCERCSQRM